MGNTTFTGPIRSGKTYGSGPVFTTLPIDKRIGITVLRSDPVSLTTASANTTIPGGILPAGSQVVDILVDVITAFNATQNNRISIGKTGANGQFLGSTGGSGPIAATTAGRYSLASGAAPGIATATQLTNCFNTGTADIEWNVTLTCTESTGSAATTPTSGAATVTLLYVQTA